MQEKFNKELYKELKSYARDVNIFCFSEDVTGQGYPYNGVSISYRINEDILNCRMIEVSVSYCAPEDSFKTKHGKFQALIKIIDTGESIKLPLGECYRDYGKKVLRSILFDMFLV